jgi:hypothetical protein
LPVLWYVGKDKLSWKNISVFAAVYVIGLAVAVSPFVIRNYIVAGKFALTTTQSGFNLYLGNNIQNPEDLFRRGIPISTESVMIPLPPLRNINYWATFLLKGKVRIPQLLPMKNHFPSTPARY